MRAPFFDYGFIGDEAGLIVGFLIGLGFGFSLERAGFGSARKLMAQFYLTDMAVLKVMFTAVVTAMLGVTYLAWMGWLDVQLVYLVPTFIWPQIVGGLLLGMGFVIGGYCPGTSVAGIATGKLDALVNLLGVGAGMLVFAVAFPALQGFYESGALGELTLSDVFHVRAGVVVFGVVLMGLGAFQLAAFAERRFAVER
jgi:hypothetical protein